MVTQEPPGLLDSPGYLLARAGSESRSRFVEALAEHDLTLSAYSVLMVLGATGGISQRQLAAAVRIDPRNLVPILDELVASGLVTRKSDPNDRRRRAMSLTPAGRTKLTRLREMGTRTETAFLTHLSAQERRQLLSLLRKLLDV